MCQHDNKIQLVTGERWDARAFFCLIENNAEGNNKKVYKRIDTTQHNYYNVSIER
jgi:hypothetical protein